jgi:hypothetical protein
MRDSEQGFVFSGWKSSFRHAPQNAALPKGTYFDRQNRDVDQIMDRPGTKVLVAQDAEDPSFLYGFIVYETTPSTFCGHFIYVRHGFRRVHIAKKLLSAALPDDWEDLDRAFTHRTRFDDKVESLGFQFVGLGAWLKGKQ